MVRNKIIVPCQCNYTPWTLWSKWLSQKVLLCASHLTDLASTEATQGSFTLMNLPQSWTYVTAKSGFWGSSAWSNPTHRRLKYITRYSRIDQQFGLSPSVTRMLLPQLGLPFLIISNPMKPDQSSAGWLVSLSQELREVDFSQVWVGLSEFSLLHSRAHLRELWFHVALSRTVGKSANFWPLGVTLLLSPSSSYSLASPLILVFCILYTID